VIGQEELRHKLSAGQTEFDDKKTDKPDKQIKGVITVVRTAGPEKRTICYKCDL
jgi:hypothetical protein